MTVQVELQLAGATLRLTLDPDPDRGRRALVHVRGHAVSHVGALEPGPMRDLVVAMARQMATTPGVLASSDAVAAELCAAIRALTVAATATIVDGVPAMPVWPSSLRTGAPPVVGPGLWPFDAELVGLQLGLRQLVKREAFSDEAEAADRMWLVTHGVTVQRVGAVEPDGRRVLFGALDPRHLTADVVRDEGGIRRGPDRDAIRQLGAGLGYPTCCIERFALTVGHDDRALVAAHTDDHADGPASPLTQWINQPLALVSHVPCAVTCDATRALAARLLDGLERACPGFARRWRDYAARVQVIDRRGIGFAVRGVGDVATGLVIEHAIRFDLPRAGDLTTIATEMPEATGRRLSRFDVIAAFDHRGD